VAAGAEKSAGSRNVETSEVDEDKRAAVEQDREQQREKISQWKVHATVNYLFYHFKITIIIVVICI